MFIPKAKRNAVGRSVARYGPLLVGGGLLVAYVARIDYQQLETGARRFAWQTAALVLLLNLGTGLLKLTRWRILTGALREGLGRRYLAVNAAFFWGLVTPGTAGELTRGMLLRDRSGRLLASILLEKITDLGALFLCVVLAAIAYFGSARSALILAVPILALTFMVVQVALRHDRLLLAIPKLILGRVLRPSHLQASKETYWQLHGLATSGGLLVTSALFSALLWLLPMAQMILIYGGLAARMGAGTAALAFFLPYLVGVLSMVPLGIGVFDLGVGRLSVVLAAAGNPAAVAPLFFRALVTLPLIVFGYACHLVLALGSRRASSEATPRLAPEDGQSLVRAGRTALRRP